jgi:hypothetical protein
MRLWKVLGLAGMAGVAATGVVIVRSERRRRAYTPDQVRERLHARVAAAAAPAEPTAPEPRRRRAARLRELGERVSRLRRPGRVRRAPGPADGRPAR